MLTQEQIKQVKEQLFKQLESWPEEQRDSAREQIESMSDEELEQFLIKNKMKKTKEAAGSHESSSLDNLKDAANQFTFCLVSSGKLQTYKIDENKQAVAILEINPVSKGHVLILPKNHIRATKIPSSALSLAKKIAKKLETKLKPKPKKIDLATTELFQHGIINIIPVYSNENLGSERKKASENELKELQEKLSSKIKAEKIEKIKVKKPKEEKTLKMPKRMP